MQAAGLHGAQFWNGDTEHFFKVGLPKWIELLLDGHKCTLIAGTDAHGNFNRFRQIGTPHFSMREEDLEIFGTVLSAVYVEGNLTLNSLLAGLRAGRVIVTDGPLAVMSFQPSTHGDQHNVISALSRISMIGDTAPASRGVINIEAVSTPLYGDISELVLVLGDIATKKETRRPIKVPLGSYALSKKELYENCPRPGYIRLELTTRLKDRQHYCFTNPIYF